MKYIFFAIITLSINCIYASQTNSAKSDEWVMVEKNQSDEFEEVTAEEAAQESAKIEAHKAHVEAEIARLDAQDEIVRKKISQRKSAEAMKLMDRVISTQKTKTCESVQKSQQTNNSSTARKATTMALNLAGLDPDCHSNPVARTAAMAQHAHQYGFLTTFFAS